jgi:hypothetical protein
MGAVAVKFEGILPAYAWSDWRKPQITAVVIHSVPDNIRTRYFPNRSQNFWHLKGLAQVFAKKVVA